MPDEFDPSIPPDRRLKYMHSRARRRLLAEARAHPSESDYGFFHETPIGPVSRHAIEEMLPPEQQTTEQLEDMADLEVLDAITAIEEKRKRK